MAEASQGGMTPIQSAVNQLHGVHNPAVRQRPGVAAQELKIVEAISEFASTDDTSREEIRAEMGIPALLVSLQSGAESDITAATCVALWYLARTESCRAAVVEAGGILALVGVLNGGHATGAAVPASAALALLLYNAPHVQDNLREAGGIEAILQLLTKGDPSSEMAQNAALALEYGCEEHEVNQSALQGHGGVAVLVRILAAGVFEEVTESAIKLLYMLAEGGLSTQQEIVEGGGFGALVYVISAGVEVDAAERAVRLVQILVDDETERQDLVRKSGGLPPIVHVLGVSEGAPSLQAAAADAIASLAYGNSTNQAVLGDAGAVQHLAAALKGGAESEAAGGAMEALWYLTRHPANRARAVEVGAVPPVVAMLKQVAAEGKAEEDSEKGDLLEAAAASLWNLALDDPGRHAIREAGGIPPLLELAGGAGGEDVGEKAIGAVWNLATLPENSAAIHGAGGVPVLAGALGRGAESKHAEMAAAALWNLVANGVGRDELVASNGIPLLVSLVQTGGGRVVATRAAGVLWNLTSTEENAEAAVEAGAVPALVVALQGAAEGGEGGGGADPDTARNVAGALANISTVGARGKAAVREAAGIPPIVALLSPPGGGSPQAPAAARFATAALANLSLDDANKDAVREAGGIPPLVRIVERGAAGGGGQGEEVLENATWALRVLSIHPENMEAVREAGGVAALVALVAAKPPDEVLENAVWALRILAISDPNKDAVRVAGGLPALAAAAAAVSARPRSSLSARSQRGGGSPFLRCARGRGRAQASRGILENTVWCLRTLALQEENRAVLVEAEGAVDTLVGLLTSDFPSVANYAAGTLAKLSGSGEGAAAVRAAGGVRGGCAALRAAEDEALAENVLWLLWGLTDEEAAEAEVRAHGGIASICASITRSTKPEFLERACMLLVEVAANRSPRRAAAEPPAAAVGGLEELVEVLCSHPDRAVVKAAVVAVSRVVEGRPSTQEAAVAASAHLPLFALLGNAGVPEDVKVWSVLALVRLCGQPTCRPALHIAGAQGLLLQYMAAPGAKGGVAAATGAALLAGGLDGGEMPPGLEAAVQCIAERLGGRLGPPQPSWTLHLEDFVGALAAAASRAGPARAAVEAMAAPHLAAVLGRVAPAGLPEDEAAANECRADAALALLHISYETEHHDALKVAGVAKAARHHMASPHPRLRDLSRGLLAQLGEWRPKGGPGRGGPPSRGGSRGGRGETFVIPEDYDVYVSQGAGGGAGAGAAAARVVHAAATSAGLTAFLPPPDGEVGETQDILERAGHVVVVLGEGGAASPLAIHEASLAAERGLAVTAVAPGGARAAAAGEGADGDGGEDGAGSWPDLPQELLEVMAAGGGGVTAVTPVQFREGAGYGDFARELLTRIRGAEFAEAALRPPTGASPRASSAGSASSGPASRGGAAGAAAGAAAMVAPPGSAGARASSAASVASSSSASSGSSGSSSSSSSRSSGASSPGTGGGGGGGALTAAEAPLVKRGSRPGSAAGSSTPPASGGSRPHSKAGSPAPPPPPPPPAGELSRVQELELELQREREAKQALESRLREAEESTRQGALRARLEARSRTSAGSTGGGPSPRAGMGAAPLPAGGTVEAVLEAMRTNAGNAKVLAEACGALQTLAAGSKEGKARAGAAGAPQAVVAAMREHPGDAGLLRAGCGALLNITTNSGANKVLAGSAGAVEAVVAAMQAHAGDVALQAQACGAIQNLATNNQENKDKGGAAGAVEAIVEAMLAHPGDANLQAQACGALCCMCANSRGNTPRAGAAGAVEAVVAAMRAHAGDADVQSRASGALTNLTYLNAENKLRGGDAGAVEAVVAAMRQFLSNRPLQKNACGAILGLTTSSDANRLRAVAAGAAAVLSAAIQAHDGDAGVQAQGALALRNLMALPGHSRASPDPTPAEGGSTEGGSSPGPLGPNYSNETLLAGASALDDNPPFKLPPALPLVPSGDTPLVPPLAIGSIREGTPPARPAAEIWAEIQSGNEAAGPPPQAPEIVPAGPGSGEPEGAPPPRASAGTVTSMGRWGGSPDPRTSAGKKGASGACAIM